MDATEIYSKRLNAKEVIFPKQGEFIFPIADGRIKTIGGDQELRTSTLVRHRPIQGESNIDFLAETEGSLPQPHDSFPDASEALNYFWSMSGNFIYRHHVEPRVKLYSPREESFPIPLKYIDVTRTTHTNLDVKQASMIIGISMDLETRLILGKVSHNLLYWKKKLPTDICGPGRDYRENSLHPSQIIYGQKIWKIMGKNAKLKERQKWSNEKPKLDNARRLRGIYSLTLRTRNSKRPSRMLARYWKHPWLPPCLARSARTIRIVGVVNPTK